MLLLDHQNPPPVCSKQGTKNEFPMMRVNLAFAPPQDNAHGLQHVVLTLHPRAQYLAFHLAEVALPLGKTVIDERKI
jgi:hypothetical protein